MHQRRQVTQVEYKREQTCKQRIDRNKNSQSGLLLRSRNCKEVLFNKSALTNHIHSSFYARVTLTGSQLCLGHLSFEFWRLKVLHKAAKDFCEN